MATSQNGWSVFTSPPSGTIPEYITGRVRPEDVVTVFTYLLDRLDSQVENVRKEWSWGWAFRAIRGQTSGFSNHASATAIDVNAPAHPLGVRGTWSSDEIDRVHAILADLEGTVRWGEDYVNRKDGMHFEINCDASRLHAIAEKIRANNMPGLRPTWHPKTAAAVHFGKVQEQFLIAAGLQEGELKRLNGVGLVQQALNSAFDLDLEVDGFVGKATLRAWATWEDRVGGFGRRRIPDKKSVDALVEYAGYDLIDDPWNADEPVGGKPKPFGPVPRKTLAQVAQEVVDGKWGDGEERQRRLKAAGFIYDNVQARVGKIIAK